MASCQLHRTAIDTAAKCNRIKRNSLNTASTSNQLNVRGINNKAPSVIHRIAWSIRPWIDGALVGDCGVVVTKRFFNSGLTIYVENVRD